MSARLIRNAALSVAIFWISAAVPHALVAQDSSEDGSVLESRLMIYDVETGEARVVQSARAHWEAPNWTPDGRHLVFNAEGLLYRIPVEGGAPELIDTGRQDDIINDHGVSPDGRLLAFTAGPERAIYTHPFGGKTQSEPARVSPDSSYWHGWSPDGQTLAYTAQREGTFDLFVIPLDGGEERQLTFDDAHDDGPDYSPDGRYIYFNTDRGGDFNIWRLPSEGGEAEQVTSDAWEDWFPHPSPDGTRIVFLSYAPGTEGHPANQRVKLRMISAEGSAPAELVDLFGGQGTINVPSWAPDGHAFAYMAYRLVDEP